MRLAADEAAWGDGDCAWTGRASFLRLVPIGEGRYRWYVRTRDVPHDAMTALATRFPDVDAVSRRHAGDRTALYEVVVDGGSLPVALASHGARLRRLRESADAPVATLEAPRGVSPRTLLEVVRRSFPTATVVAQRTVSCGGEIEGQGRLERALTERQRTVLEAAYFGGYFDADREVTGAALAESLGIAGATFHEHLRAAHRNLLRALFEDDSHDPLIYEG